MQIFDYGKIKDIQGNCGLVKASFIDSIGFARVSMNAGLSTPHYHKYTTEYYLVIAGRGILKVKGKDGLIQKVELNPNKVVKIEPLEIHQTNNLGGLILEAITSPVWTAVDELVVGESLF